MEKVTSTWPPGRFATLCNTVAWAASGRSTQTIPSFTSRVNVKDGGVDATWDVEIPTDNGCLPTPILVPGWNIFQYKQRDVFSRKRRSLVSNLRSSLTGALSEVEKNFTRKPDRYTLFLNIHLTPHETVSLKESILAEEAEDDSRAQIIGAAELAALLNDHPHLRAAFFAPLAFQTWEDAYNAHRSKKRFASTAELVGRESELDRLKNLVNDPQIKAIVVSGPHDMGKSRLALEATKHKPYDVAVALNPASIDLTDYRNLCTDRSQVLCIIEDPEFDTLQSLIGEALSVPGLKLVITLPMAEDAPDLSYGFDNRVASLPLSPLSDESARKLLLATGQALDFGVQDWILSQTGGVPGIILAAASIASTLRQDHTAFSTKVGREFERRIVLELGEAALQAARLLSVLSHVGIAAPHEAELQTICKIFGNGQTPHETIAHLPELEKSGLIKRAGYFVGLSLPLLANHLVEQLLQGRSNEMLALFATLDEAGRIRFIKRLAQVKGPETEQFWDGLFAPDGLLGAVDRVLKRTHLLRLIAGTVPHRVLQVIENYLRNSAREARLNVSGDFLRGLMGALDQLVFRTNTSKDALRLIWLLAEVEDEPQGNAVSMLQQCFYPRHSQMPLPLSQRAALIKEQLSSTPTTETKLLAIKVIESALKSQASIYLRRSVGPSPLDTHPPLTWNDMFSYLGSLAEILVSLTEEPDEVSHAALGVLPQSIAELAFQGLTEESSQYFKLLTDWALAERQGLDVSHLAGIMHRVRDFCARQIAKPDLPEDRKLEYTEFISQLTAWQASLNQARFPTRLKLWAGGGSYRVSDDWKQVEEQLSLLAKEVAQSPEILTPDLLKWLLTASAKETRRFFYTLGKEDHTLYFQNSIESLGKNALGGRAFAPYFAGWATRDLEGAERRLDQLAELHSVSAASLLETTSWLDPTPRGLNRIKQVAPKDPEYTTAILGRWIDRIDPKEFKELLHNIAGTNYKHASAAVVLLGSWMHHQKPFDDELSAFAWRCIEHGPTKRAPRSAEGWHFDKLAAKLTESNPDMGFRKFHQLLTTPATSSLEWEPLDMDGGKQWWETLRARDRPRLFHTLLDASCANDTTQEVLSWRLKDLLGQEQDAHDLLAEIGTNVAYAHIAARWLVGSASGFWDLAFRLIKKFPHDSTLQNVLTSAAMDTGAFIRGPVSQFYEARNQEVQKRLEDPSTPAEAHAWLRDTARVLGLEVKTQLVWEYDREVNDLKRYLQEDDVEQKRWAVGRILKYADWSDVRKLLTVDDIEEALPYIDIPERRRAMIERLLPTWEHAG
ncbi:MAG: ATP-binding protein [Nitrospira sp.]|nr:ATP-binding protein [Nitrospira sp.]MBH0183650.1 ATP-binding protein [Nitrospira sp.]MBH0186186.1 ATP-binding protein [Nitrospira sp.]